MAAITGLPQLEKKLRGLVESKKKNLERGLIEAGKLLLAESMKEVPVDFGFLKGSGFVRLDSPAAPGQNPRVTVGYTDPKAIWVHENLNAAHGEDWNVKHAKDLANFQARQKAVKKKIKQMKASSKLPAAYKADLGSEKLARLQMSPYRHERGSGQKAKFLEGPFRRLQKELKDMVKSYL